ncbi:MAG: HSP90 family protein [Clostridiales bacterium]|nr:HSP90 family protein [Clostridiales bacterium]
MPYRFQVNLGGILDVLSNHLYKSPDVFLRELLQNGVDAVTLRRKGQPGWDSGRIVIRLEPGRRLEFQDNGAGLSEEGIHRFLAIIGQSSKAELIDGRIPEDYIGRFGIGLLSCFMVSDTIEIHTRTPGGPAHVWIGRADGTYTLEPQDSCPEGTTVMLTARPGAEHYFQPETVERLVRYYGLALPVPVYLEGEPERINRIPEDFSAVNRSQLLSFGEWLFGEEFLDAIPIQTPHISGVAYVLPCRTDVSVKVGHRIYLKQMLLTERGDTLLPEWAFFLRCFLNTRSLRPTASREDFYEDGELAAARTEFSQAVGSYLAELSQDAPERLQRVVDIHAQAIKAMAIWDDSLFRLFIDYLPFETSEGTMTGRALKQAGAGAWVGSVPKFKQLRPLFMTQGRLLICTGYTSDEELVEKLADDFSLPLEPLREDQLELVMEAPAPEEEQRAFALLRAADRGLKEFDCRAELRRFLPGDLPALYAMSDEVGFLRRLQSAQKDEGGLFSGALASLLESAETRPLATLYLNQNSPLIQRLIENGGADLLQSVIRVLYIQALLAGGHSLHGGERKLLNRELLRLVEFAGGQGKEKISHDETI